MILDFQRRVVAFMAQRTDRIPRVLRRPDRLVGDEPSTINVTVWRTAADRYRRELLGSTLLTVTGHVERVETSAVPVVHLIAARLSDQSQLLGDLTVPSRDFH